MTNHFPKFLGVFYSLCLCKLVSVSILSKTHISTTVLSEGITAHTHQILLSFWIYWLLQEEPLSVSIRTLRAQHLYTSALNSGINPLQAFSFCLGVSQDGCVFVFLQLYCLIWVSSEILSPADITAPLLLYLQHQCILGYESWIASMGPWVCLFSCLIVFYINCIDFFVPGLAFE